MPSTNKQLINHNLHHRFSAPPGGVCWRKERTTETISYDDDTDNDDEEELSNPKASVLILILIFPDDLSSSLHHLAMSNGRITNIDMGNVL